MREVLVVHVAEDRALAEELGKTIEAEGPRVWLVKAEAPAWSARVDAVFLHTRASGPDPRFLGLLAEARRRGQRLALFLGDDAEVAPSLAGTLDGAPRHAALADLLAWARAAPARRPPPRKVLLPALVLGEAAPEEGLTWASVWKGWGLSMALHAAILVSLGLLVTRVRSNDPAEFQSALMAGESDGDVLGPSRLMGGTDETALAPSEAPVALDGPVLSTTPIGDLKLKLGPARTTGPSTPGQGGGRGGDGFGMARFGPGNETIRGVDVRTGDPQFTLIWDSAADLDLHVIEPGGPHIYWVEKGRPTKLGGTLDVDNVKGFGPENIYWEHGQGPPGEYKWYVHYFGGFGGYDVPTRWQVRIKNKGEENVVEGRFRKIGEKSRVFTLRVGPADSR